MPSPEPRIRCRCGYPLAGGQDCPECGGTYWDAVRWSTRQQRPRPIRLIILTAIVLLGVISPAILTILVRPAPPTASDLDAEGMQLACGSLVLWCATGLLAFCGIIACLQHIGRTRWEALVWIMLAIPITPRLTISQC